MCLTPFNSTLGFPAETPCVNRLLSPNRTQTCMASLTPPYFAVYDIYQQNRWRVVGQDAPIYVPCVEDEGCKIKVLCTPLAQDGLRCGHYHLSTMYVRCGHYYC